MTSVRPLALALSIVVAAHAGAQVQDTTQLRVVAITVEGNDVTQPRVILRELTLREQDVMQATALYTRLERSRQNLLNTSLFNTVDITPLYVSTHEVVVQVKVNERWYLWPSPIIEVADPNFNTWWKLGHEFDRLNIGFYLYRYNFRGLNETVSAQFQFGYSQKYALRYAVPNLDKRQRWGASFGGGYFQQQEITVGTVANDRVFFKPVDGNARTFWHIDGDATLRPRHDLKHVWRLSYTNASITDSAALATPQYFGDTSTTTAFLSAGYSIIWDSRDSRAFAHKGMYADLKIDRLGLGLLGENEPDITTFFASLKRWWSVGSRVVIAAGVQGKATVGGEVPYFVQEGLGYRYTVRGYEYYVNDGRHFVLGRSNFLFALIKPRSYYVAPIPLEAFRTLHVALYFDLFADAGRVWDDRSAELNPLNNEWLSGYGAGLDLVTSYDQVVRVEYSRNALGEDGLFLHFTQPF